MNGIDWHIAGVKAFVEHPVNCMYHAETTDANVLILFTHNYDKVQLWDIYDGDESILERFAEGQQKELTEIIKGFL
jgi:hypothetical protein